MGRIENSADQRQKYLDSVSDYLSEYNFMNLDFRRKKCTRKGKSNGKSSRTLQIRDRNTLDSVFYYFPDLANFTDSDGRCPRKPWPTRCMKAGGNRRPLNLTIKLFFISFACEIIYCITLYCIAFFHVIIMRLV